jgi:hypothetical protein
VGAVVDRVLEALRTCHWASTRHVDPDEPGDRFNAPIPLSFRTFDNLRSAPAIVFGARKPPEAG